jgi:hypothetical protein
MPKKLQNLMRIYGWKGAMASRINLMEKMKKIAVSLIKKKI